MASAAAVKRFFRSPKGLLLIILALVLAVAVPGVGWARVGPLVGAAILAAAAIDVVILRIRGGRWVFPSGAILTGAIAAMVLSPLVPWYVAAITGAIAVVSKYAIRVRTANVFNPAALALVIVFYGFNTAQDWWGALPESNLAVGLAVLIATGVFITHRVNKLPLALSFLGAHFLLFTVTAFAANPAHVAEVFRPPDLQAALFFAFFILTDPPTSPVPYLRQLVCGALVAAVSYAIFETTGAAYFLLGGVLAGNAWEAWRRRQSRAR